MREKHGPLRSTFRVFNTVAATLLGHTSLLLGLIFLTNAVAAESPKYLKDDIFFEIVEPESLKYTFRLRPAHEFGTSFVAPLSNVGLVLAEPFDGCSSPVNKLELRHNVVLIERGGCSFLSKCIQAHREGVLAVIITDNNPTNDDQYIDMMDDNTHRNCSIPAAFLLGKDGYMIRRGLETHGLNRAIINIPINVTVVPAHKVKRPPWLVW
uniref:Putative protease-associated domain-containing protein of 21 kDa n=2 Tax=Ornithodoros turicata TaxID=34597 RepID=A0A2R5LGY0_9ACAR